MTWRNPAAFAISYIRELCRRYPWNTSFGGAVFFCEEKPPVVVPAACAVEAASSFFFFSSRVNSWSFCRGESALAAPFLLLLLAAHCRLFSVKMPLFFLLSADASALLRRFSCHKEDPSHSSPDRNTTVSLFLQRRNIIIGTNPPRISRSRPYSFSEEAP